MKKKKAFYKRWWFWLLVLVIAAFAACGGSGSGNDAKKVGEVAKPAETEAAAAGESAGTETEKETTAQSEAPADVKTVYKVGDILQDGDLQIVYVSSGDYEEENEYMQPADGNKYIFLKFAFINTSSKSDASISFYNFECYADGYACEMHYNDDEALSATLSAGRSTSGKIYFEVPADAEEIEVEYTTNYFSSDKITFTFDGDQDSGYTLETNTQATEGAYKPGETAESKQMKITYVSCEEDTSYDSYFAPKDGYHYITCTFEFENTSSSDEMVSMYEFDCFADGVSCEMAYFREDGLSATLSAGRKTSGTVTFAVPDGAQTVEVEYLTNFWTSNRVVFSAE